MIKRTTLLSLGVGILGIYGILLVLILALGFYVASPLAAQDVTGTPRPTPTNVGDGPRVTPTDPATATPEPPTATPEPLTEAPTEAPPDEDEPSSPPQEPAEPEPQQDTVQVSEPQPAATVATTVPNTGLMDVESWSVILLALGLVGTIFGARYLRRHHKDQEKEKGPEGVA